MNKTIEQLLAHYSVRNFLDKPLPEETITQLIKSAQSASTSNFIQAYSIIGVTDKKLRKELATIAGNSTYVETTGQFFVFVADLARSQKIAVSKGADYSSLETTEKWLVSVIDATLAAQNMAVAAESMGLGVCFIGGIRNDITRTTELLNIPPYALPLFGLTIGYPDQKSAPKPRMPQNLVYHENQYQKKADQLYSNYDEIIREYYNKRTKGERIENWTDQIAHSINRPTRLDLRQLLDNQHLAKK